MKKTLALLLALVLTFSAAAFTAAADDVQYKGTIKCLLGYTPTDPNEEPPAKKIEELTGYKVIYYNLPADPADADNKLNLEISSGAEYDIIKMNITQFRTLAPMGVFVDLNEYLPGTTYLKDIMNEQEWSCGAMDGQQLAIPQYDAYYVPGGLTYNVQMWEAAGFKLDEENPDRQLTFNEFTEILTKVKEKYPDAIPFTEFRAYSWPIMSAFGIVNHDWMPDIDGTIVPRFGHSKIKDYISAMRDLYEKGLLDVEMPINKGENVDQKFTAGQASSRYIDWAATTAIEASLLESTGNTVDYLFPISDENGLTRMASNAGPSSGFAAIPKSSKQAAAVIDFLDIRANPEVFTETFLGVEGEQWEFRDTDGDGVQEYWPLLGEEYDPGFTAWFNGHYFNIVNSPESFTTLWLCRVRKGEVQYNATMKTNQYPRENWVDSPLAYAPPLPAVAKYQAALNVMSEDYIKECIAGTRSVDEYETVYAEWLAEGGQEMIDDVNAYIGQ